MQISNAQVSQQFQRVHPQTTSVEGTASEETNESASTKAEELQKSAVAQSTGIGVSLDTKI
jgi:hypothetical protein